MITLHDFIEKYTGQKVSFPNCDDNQCMTLMHAYIAEVYGLTDPLILATPLAYQVYQNFQNLQGASYFTHIPNTPTGVPSPGDIIVFAPNGKSSGTGIAGHVAIFVTGDTNSFISFDADYPYGALPREVEHTYGPDGKDVLGWLTPKPQGTFVDTATFEQLVTKSAIFDTFVTGGYSSIDAIHQKLQSSTDQIASLQKQIGELTRKNEELALEVQSNKDQMAKLADITQQQATADSAAIDQGVTASQQVKDLTYDLTVVATDLGTTYPPVKNLTGAISTLQTQLKAAQMEITKIAIENNVRAQQATQAVQTVSKGFFSWLKDQVWVSRS